MTLAGLPHKAVSGAGLGAYTSGFCLDACDVGGVIRLDRTILKLA